MSNKTSNTAHQVKSTDKFDQLKNDSAKCRIQLMTKKELIKGEVTRLKRDMRNIAWLEENGLSPQNLLISIGKSYDKLVKKSADLVEDWQSFITLTASSKGPIQTNEDRVSQGGIFQGNQGAMFPRNPQAHTKCWQKFTRICHKFDRKVFHAK